MRVLVCGGRDFTDFEFLKETLSRFFWERELIHADCTLIHGCAAGADFLAGIWAREYSFGINLDEYPADWKKYGRTAGPIRNQQMLDEGKPDIVIAFPGDRGTANMIKKAKDAGIRVIEVSYNPES